MSRSETLSAAGFVATLVVAVGMCVSLPTAAEEPAQAADLKIERSKPLGTLVFDETPDALRRRVREEKIDEIERQIKKLHAHARELENADKPDQLERVRREIEKLEKQLHDLRHAKQQGREHEHRDFDADAYFHNLAEGVKHLRAAARHLEQARLADLADNLRQQAEAVERRHERHAEMVERRQRRDREMRERHRGADGDVGAAINELREEVGRLRGEVRELHKRLERDE